MFKLNGGRDEAWQIDVTIKGHRIKRSLDTNIAEAAQSKAINDFIRPAKSGQWNAVQQTRLKSDFALLGEVIDTFSRLADCDPFVARGYKVTFWRVVRRGLGDEGMSEQKLREQSSSVLTGALVSAFEEWMRADATAHKRDGNSTKRSVAADLRNARAVFKKDLRPRYRELGLKLPDLSDFMERATSRAPRLMKLPAPDELLARTFAAAEALRSVDRAAYVAWLLGVSSLRRREVSLSKWSWMQRLDGRPYLVLDAASTKSGSTRAVAVDELVLRELEEYRAYREFGANGESGTQPVANQSKDFGAREFILPGPVGVRLRGQSIFRRVDAWMRALGWTTNHTMHELRAYAVRRVRRDYGIEAAQAQAGHADQRTTIEHYAGERGVEDVTVSLPMTWATRERRAGL